MDPANRVSPNARRPIPMATGEKASARKGASPVHPGAIRDNKTKAAMRNSESAKREKIATGS